MEVQSLRAFVDELQKIAVSYGQLVGAQRLPAPPTIPKIDPNAVGKNFYMHMPTAAAQLARPAAASTTAKTIPATVNAITHAIMRAPSSFPAAIAKTLAPVARATHL